MWQGNFGLGRVLSRETEQSTAHQPNSPFPNSKVCEHFTNIPSYLDFKVQKKLWNLAKRRSELLDFGKNFQNLAKPGVGIGWRSILQRNGQRSGASEPALGCPGAEARSAGAEGQPSAGSRAERSRPFRWSMRSLPGPTEGAGQILEVRSQNPKVEAGAAAKFQSFLELPNFGNTWGVSGLKTLMFWPNDYLQCKTSHLSVFCIYWESQLLVFRKLYSKISLFREFFILDHKYLQKSTLQEHLLFRNVNVFRSGNQENNNRLAFLLSKNFIKILPKSKL